MNNSLDAGNFGGSSDRSSTSNHLTPSSPLPEAQPQKPQECMPTAMQTLQGGQQPPAGKYIWSQLQSSANVSVLVYCIFFNTRAFFRRIEKAVACSHRVCCTHRTGAVFYIGEILEYIRDYMPIDFSSLINIKLCV